MLITYCWRRIVFKGSCHCEKVKFELLVTPNHLTECNCSICYRIGAIWAHAAESEILISCVENDLTNYSWGDKSIKFFTCKTCGCTTHWKSVDTEQSARMAVNARMVDRANTKGIKVRQFDGADSFEFID